MLGRPQDIDADPLGERGDEGAAMGVAAVRPLGPAVGLAGPPVNMVTGDPFRLDAHRVERVGKPEALGRDRLAGVGSRREGDETGGDQGANRLHAKPRKRRRRVGAG